MITQEKFQTTCSDGVILKGTLILPEKPKAVVQFNAGTAAKKEFYLAFLTCLAENDYACCLWDYRGSGESAPEDLSKCDYTFSDYGLKDMPAIKVYLKERFSKLPLLLFVHSAGGQQVGLAENLDGYIGMVGFAVSTGYLPDMPLANRLQTAYFFYIFTPLSILLKGYLAAKRFGYMEDLPKNVVLEWRRWCARPDYLFDQKFYGKTIPKGHYQNMPFPIHIYWTTDDYISNKRSVPRYWSHVKSEYAINFTKLIPAEQQEKSIGHFGFFKKKGKDKFWPMGLAKLDAFLEAHLLES